MKAKNLFLPSLGLGIAALLALPGENVNATFSTIGNDLSVSQREFRVFDNFADAQANNNTTPHPMYPGQTGAELAIWKGAAEWSGVPHGDGSGDPVGGNVIGSGASNFEPFFAGIASNSPGADQRIVYAVPSCGGGTLAQTLIYSNDSWQIQFCDNWNWADGPGGISGSTYDLQGIMAHEYGHALGLGHSCNGGATMRPSGSAGQTALRSINADDIAGIQSIYGTVSASKPAICETLVSGSTLTIVGANFSASNNEVWFTNANATAPNTDPRVRLFNVPSTLGGTRIDVTIPANAGPGEVAVKLPGTANSAVSNAYPTDLVNSISTPDNCPLILSSVTPDVVPALMPGTTQEITLTGSGFTGVTEMLFSFFTTIPPSNYTIVNDTTITLDMPQHTFLGPAVLSVSNGTVQRDISITIEASSSPLLQLGTGDDFNVSQDGDSMPVIMAGEPGRVHRIYYSPSPVKSIHPVATFCLGNNFSEFFFATAASIGASGGFTEFGAPVDWMSPPQDFYCQSIDMTTYEVSNLQIITLIP